MLRSGALGHLECQLRGTCHVHVFLRKLCSHLGCSIMCRRHPVVVEKTERTSSESLYSAFLARPCHMKKKNTVPLLQWMLVHSCIFCATKWDQNESYTSSILNYWSSDSRGVMMPYLRVQHWWWVPTLGRLLHEGCPGLWAKDGKRQNNAKHN